MPDRREKVSVHEDPVQFKLPEFNAEVAQKFLPGWELTRNDQTVTFQQKQRLTEEDERIKQIDIDLEEGVVMILELKNEGKDATLLVSLNEIDEITMHSRFGYPFITFLNPERFLVFQPQSMEVASALGKPIGHMLMK